MSLRERLSDKKEFAQMMGSRMTELLHGRGNLNQDDLEYVVNRLEKMKDTRLKECIGSLIGWGDEERAEIETTFAVLLEIAKNSNPSKIHNAVKMVEIRFLAKFAMQNNPPNPTTGQG